MDLCLLTCSRLTRKARDNHRIPSGWAGIGPVDRKDQAALSIVSILSITFNTVIHFQPITICLPDLAFRGVTSDPRAVGPRRSPGGRMIKQTGQKLLYVDQQLRIGSDDLAAEIRERSEESA